MIVQHRKQKGVTKDAVLAMHAAHPQWNASRIARELKCVAGYVRATLNRNDIKNPGTRPARKKKTRIRVVAIEGHGTAAVAAASQLMTRFTKPDDKQSRRRIAQPYWID